MAISHAMHSVEAAAATSASPSEEQPRGGVVRRALTSASFIEKATLLLLTEIVVPILIIYFNVSAAERQKALEANKARDASIFKHSPSSSASLTVSSKMQSLLALIYSEQDTPIHQLHGIQGAEWKWEVLHRKSEAMLADADHLIAELANDIGLTKENLHKANP